TAVAEPDGAVHQYHRHGRVPDTGTEARHTVQQRRAVPAVGSGTEIAATTDGRVMWRFGLLLILAGRAWACSCGGNWPSVRGAWKSADAVFVGTVEVANPDEDLNHMMFREQLVRIRVNEAFKGVTVAEKF